MEGFEQLVNEFKGSECTFCKMECAFAAATGDEVLDNIGVSDLLEKGSVCFQLDTEENIDEYLNVEFEIIKENIDNPLETIIKVTNLDIV